MNIRLFRKLHQTVAPFVLLPLLITVLTGVSYRLGRSWFGLTRDQAHWLMTLHEGEYLGETLEPVYVLLNGLGALWMLITGATMVWQNISKSKWMRRSSKSTVSESAAGSSEGTSE
ncbi:MAG: PepSY domain-containing protein [Leptolyngbya sp. IPPAS B-1204]|nr:PepSY domain-containing protein [Elainella sp. C42_A2020_010]